VFQQVRSHPCVTASPLSLEEAANGSRECAPDDRLRAVSKDGLQYRFVIPGTRTTPDQMYGLNWCGTGWNLFQPLTSRIGRREPVFRRASMADVSEFSIVTYQRKPGCWRQKAKHQIY